MGEKKILMVLAHTGFRDKEFLVSKKMFEQNNLNVVVASDQSGEAIGEGGHKVKIDIIIRDVCSQNYCAVVVVGGPGVASLINNHDLSRVLKDFASHRKIVAAISSTPVILANAGLLIGIKSTVSPEKKHDLEMGGAYYTGRHVEKDGLFITANSPESSEDFAKEIVKTIDYQRKVHKNISCLRSSFRRF